MPDTDSQKTQSPPPTPPTPQPQWRDENLHDPHHVADKAERVQRMFAAIAGSYDLNNRLHSLGRDQAWRRKAVKLCGLRPGGDERVLDVACGTGDLSLAMAEAGPGSVLGVDFTHEMLQVAAAKELRWRWRSGMAHGNRPAAVSFVDGDAMRLPIASRSVDVVSIAFGIRNVADPAAALREFHRVLRPGGRLCILEFSTPTNTLLRRAYLFYFRRIMPITATLISRDRSGAYKYLPKSVNTFLSREQLAGMMGKAGFRGVSQHPLTFGIAVAYIGRR